MNKLIHGVGLNDADYAVNSTGVDGRTRCPIYIQWKNMFQRCYSKNYQSRQPTYEGCTVDERWHSFMSFRDWVIGNQWEGKKAIDKDILVEGNKIYGPDTCVIVDYPTNNFFREMQCGKRKGKLAGVRYTNKRYQTLCGISGKSQGYGSYDTPEEAHFVYLKLRHERAIVLAVTQTDSRVSHILRTRFLPKS